MAKDDPIRREIEGREIEGREIEGREIQGREIQGRPPGEPEGRGLRCEEWECLVVEALDGNLDEAQAAAFEQHRQQCSTCAQALEQSRRGAQWLRFLENQPEPPPDLVDAILAATSGSGMLLPGASSELTAFWRSPALPRSRSTIAPWLGAPGLMMTAAMAFFSLALTIHLLGVSPRHVSVAQIHLAGLPISDLRPSVVGLTVTRQYYSLEERGAKFYDNLLLVREVEAEARELEASDETEPAGSGARSTPAPGQSPTSRNRGAALPERDFRTVNVAAAPLGTLPRHAHGSRA